MPGATHFQEGCMANATVRGLVLFGLLGALPVGPARAQEEGDTVVLTLKSGKKVTGVLVSKGDSQIKVRVGSSDMTLPAGMVASIESASGGEAAPAPSAPAPDAPSAPAPDGAPNAPAPGAGSGPASGAPRPVSIMMKDGKLLEVHVLAKNGTKIWVVTGKAMAIDEGDIEEAFGSLEPAGGPKGLVLTGDKGADATRLVEELDCGVRQRIDSAFAALKGLGMDAVPAFMKGLKSKTTEARDLCIEALTAMHVAEAQEPLQAMLRNDPDARIRCSIAGRLGDWDPPGARRAILEAVWQDRDGSVKTTGLLALEKTAGPEEASALIDLLSILPSESPAYVSLFRVLKKSTGEKIAPDAALWMKWWDEGGREKIGEIADNIRSARYRKDMAAKFGGTADEPKPEAEGPPVEDVLQPPTEAMPGAPEAPPEPPK
jgi:hypothetical protein